MLTLQGGGRRLVIDETGGARIVSVLDRHGFEFLARGNPPRPDLVPAGDLAATGYQGWIECFPSIDREPDPARGPGVELPGHGLLWPRPWAVGAASTREAVLSCWINSIEVAFTRRVTLGDDSLLVTSSVTNRSAAPIPYVWASHPLFAVDDSTWVDLHDDAHVSRWPDDGAGPSPLASVWPSRGPRRRWADLPVGTAVKVFRPWPADGVTFSSGGKARSLQFRVSGEEQAPYLGLWLNQRGFPDDHPLTHLAIEPTIGSTDSLSTSMERGTAGALAAGASVRFEVTLVF